MKRIAFFSVLVLGSLIFLTATYHKTSNQTTIERKTTEEAINYWYDGKAEISSFELTQARYGEKHEGTAVLVYVTEPFSKTANTKADYDNKSNIPVLKLNTTKKFVTGIYPYSMMNTTFFPFENGETSLKIASSMQEWCGMTYLEMKNNVKLVFNLNSYFEGVSFKNKALNKTIFEDDLWSLIRLNPELLPTGEHQVVPSMFYTLLKHKSLEATRATITINEVARDLNYYVINYPELERKMTIMFKASFPYSILGWEEVYPDGYGARKKVMTTTAKLIKTLKTDYWNQNSNEDRVWRGKLGL